MDRWETYELHYNVALRAESLSLEMEMAGITG
jgi:hypothetical protein